MKIYLNFLLFCALSSLALASNHEGFMLEDEKFLKKVRGNWTCDDMAFNKIFPFCTQRNVDTSVGRIVRSDGVIETGTIIESDGEKVTGITAKHVLFNGSIPVYGQFYQCSMRVSSGEVSSLAEIKIDEILTDDGSSKDIALFKGKYQKKTPRLSAQKLSQFVTPIAEKRRKRKHIKIHHYPLGVEDQRVNMGDLDPNAHKAHYVSTLPGSSGAPIFNSGGTAIIGIHKGAGNQIKKVQYTGKIIKNLKGQEFSLSDNNEYDDILRDELHKFDKIFKDTAKGGKKKK